MSIIDKFKNKAEDALGQAKEKFGAATGDKSLEIEGQADQVKSDVKQAAENVKDALKK